MSLLPATKKLLLASAAALGLTLGAAPAMAAGGPQLQMVWGGNAGTVVFIHGKGDCSRAMTDCNSADAATGPVGYWTNDSNSVDMLNEATTRIDSAGGVHYYEAFAIGYDLATQGYWYSANDVGACLADLFAGTNSSGCNPSLYQRTNIQIVTHSAGAPVVDRLLSANWYGVNSSHISQVMSLAPALAGSRASSSLYGVDGYSGFCGTLVSWLAGWSLKNNGAQSLTRGAVTGQANAGYQGKSPIWINKVTTTGGSYSANNDGCGTLWSGVTVREDDNDCEMGALSGCLGYSSSDDLDGLLYWSDSDPTNNTAGNNCPTGDHSCHNYGAFTGYYWHWFESWANHSHSRDDAYNTLGDAQTSGGCNTRTPGTCVGHYLR